MIKEIKAMDKAVKCLALELHAPIWNDVNAKWQKLKVKLAEQDKVNTKLLLIQCLVANQAEDEGLWFQAQTAPEAYLQHELRELHAMIETQTGVK